MLELWNAATAPVNLPLTVLFGVVLLYWFVVGLGLLDMDCLNLDIGVELDVDADTDVGGHGLPGSLSFLEFFNVGSVPITALLSVLIVCMWCFSVWLNDFLGNSNFWFAAVLWIPVFLVAALVTKFITLPLAPFFKALNDQSGSAHESVIGKTCTILSTRIAEDDMGQAEVRADGATLKLNVVAITGETLKRGEAALIINEDCEKKVYVVKRFSMDGT